MLKNRNFHCERLSLSDTDGSMATDCAIATTGNIIVGNFAYVQARIHEGYGSATMHDILHCTVDAG